MHGGPFSAVNREGKVITTTETYTNIHIYSITKRYQALKLFVGMFQFVRFVYRLLCVWRMSIKVVRMSERRKKN